MDVYVDTPRWLARATPRQGSPRLFCFPHAGGTAAEYLGWAADLPGVEVCAIQWPGRGNRWREPPLADMPDLVTAVVDRIPFGSHGPFAFFGHSLGALVAYEVTRVLRDRGRTMPYHLVLSGYPAPSRPRVVARPPVHALADDDLLDEIGRRYGPLPAEVLSDPWLRSVAAGALRADFRVLETYRWQDGAPLETPITVLGGRQDTLPADGLHAWQRHTTSPVSVRLFPGGHFYLREHAPAVRAALLDAVLAPVAAAA